MIKEVASGQQEEQPKSQHQVTESLVKDLEELIMDPKTEVKKGVLNILMQCMQTEDQRAMFEKSPIFVKALMNYINFETLEVYALTCLIQLSSDDIFHEQMKSLECADRLVNNIKDIIEEIVKNDFQISKKQALMIELSTLVLVNFTQSVLGKNSFLSMGREDQQQGINIMILMKIFENEKTAYMMKYFSNILVNISAYETGRKLLIQPENDFFRICLPFLVTKDKNIRTGIQKTIRNCIFEYEDEDFMERLFSKDLQFIDNICIAILTIINSSKHLSYKGMEEGVKSEKISYSIQQKLTEFGGDKDLILENKQGAEADIAELYILIDCLLILTNVDIQSLKPPMSSALVTETMEILKNIKFSNEITDKIEVLTQFF